MSVIVLLGHGRQIVVRVTEKNRLSVTSYHQLSNSGSRSYEPKLRTVLENDRELLRRIKEMYGIKGVDILLPMFIKDGLSL